MTEQSYPIHVYSGLITAEHHQRMGAAVWTYLWCLDHQTDDKGRVLGGKPVKAKEIGDQLGLCEDRVRDHLAVLDKEQYIQAKRTPYGISITILNQKKFKKRVGENTSSGLGENTNSEPRDSVKTPTLTRKNTNSGTGENTNSNKTRQLDNTVEMTSKNNAPSNVVAVTETEEGWLKTLQAINGYPYDLEKDIAHLRGLATEFLDVDVGIALKNWSTWLLDRRPLKNWRLGFRNWMTIAQDKQRKQGGTHGRSGSGVSALYDFENTIMR